MNTQQTVSLEGAAFTKFMLSLVDKPYFAEFIDVVLWSDINTLNEQLLPLVEKYPETTFGIAEYFIANSDFSGMMELMRINTSEDFRLICRSYTIAYQNRMREWAIKFPADRDVVFKSIRTHRAAMDWLAQYYRDSNPRLGLDQDLKDLIDFINIPEDLIKLLRVFGFKDLFLDKFIELILLLRNDISRSRVESCVAHWLEIRPMDVQRFKDNNIVQG